MLRCFRYLYLIALPFLFAQCDPCLGGDSCADIFAFKLVDKITKKDLIFGSPAVYNRDSVLLLTNLPGYIGTIAHADSLGFKTFLPEATETLFLQLNTLDTDTVLISYNYTKTRCCPHLGKIISMKYNGVTVKQEGQIYVFEK